MKLRRLMGRCPQAEDHILAHRERKKSAADVRLGSKADIEAPPPDVRFTPNSGHRPMNYEYTP